VVSPQNAEWLRKRTPRLIAAAIGITILIVIIIEILEDTSVNAPLTGGPLLLLWNGIVLITRNVTAAISSWGYEGVFALMLLESTSLPVPSEVVLPFAGYLVSLGQLNFVWTVVLATIAGIAGSLVDYYIGWKGWNFLSQQRILGRSLISKSQFDLAANWFTRHGSIIVFLSRLVPGFRTIVSFPAGAMKMRLPKFIAYTAAGCLIWNALLIYLGYFLGSRWSEVAGVSHYFIIAAVVSLVALIAAYLLWRRRTNANKNSECLN
jgi:membrane protein DedA with SNARE-associated domain